MIESRYRDGSDRGRPQRLLATVLAGLFLALAPLGALANQEKENKDKDTQSRHELQDLAHIPLTLSGGIREDIHNVIVIQTRFITVKQTRFGIDSDNLDRANVSEVPLLGSLFEKPLRGADLTDANRVGAVYSTGNGGLVAFVDDGVAVDESGISVVNAKFRYTLTGPAQAAQAGQLDLGELGKLTSVGQAVTGQAPEGTTIVLRGLTTTSVPPVEDKVPVLGDVPVLRQFFRGSVHSFKDDLIFFVRPSIIAGDGAD
ncbi:hypothetical protein [Pelagibius marinus]|uniref:hypothetical protein n=1 Tax=Pelagibius marinus TaxID=2762760 RepID=UPI00187300B2|nr:hypothetical protein [Pelagibius marinus]